MNTLEGYQTRILDALTLAQQDGSAAHAPTVRHRRRFAATGAGLAAAAAAAAFAAVSLTSSPAFAVDTLPDGRVQVRVAPDFTQASALQERLASSGIDIDVTIGDACHMVQAVDSTGHPLLDSEGNPVLAFSDLPDRGGKGEGVPPRAAERPRFTRTEDGFILGPGPVGPGLRLVVARDSSALAPGDPCPTAP